VWKWKASFGLCVAASVIVSCATASSQPRMSVSLNAEASAGVWTFTPIAAYDRDNDATGPKRPVSVPPGPIAVPSFWSDSNPAWDDDWKPADNPHNKWIEQAQYSRAFDVPASMEGKRIKLHFGAVNHAAEVRVNGRLVGPKHFQGTVPFEYDITDFVSAPSTGNTLTVMVWDHNHLRDASDPSKYAYPFGHAMWAHKMSGISQDVTLRSLPSMHVKDVFVQTSVETMTVVLSITLRNEGELPRAVTIENDLRRITAREPAERSRLERTLNTDRPTTVRPGEEVVVTLTDRWPEAALWWPHDPQLYRLHTRLVERGETVDEKCDVRFGFREFKIDPKTGNRYHLNGLPFRGRGATVNVMTRNLYQDREAIEYVIDTHKAFGAVLIRHGAAVPPAPLFWDVCDEKGMLCIEELFYNGQNENEGGRPWSNGIMYYTNSYGDPAFERHVDEMARAIVRRDRNHPSIVIWSIENEIFYNLLSYQPTEKQMDDVARVRGVIEGLDPTRLVGCDHEGTLNGRLQIKNKHYPGRVRDLNDDFREKSWGDWSPYDSDTDIYWVMAAEPPRVPFGVGEFHWLKQARPDDPDHIYNPYNWGRMRAYQVRAYRLFGMSDIRPFSYPHDALTSAWHGASTRNSHMINRRSLSAVAVFDHDYDARDPRRDWIAVDEGSSNIRRYDVYNDDLADPVEAITINWQVRLYDQLCDSGCATVDVPLAASRPVELTWTAPRVNQDTNFIVALEAIKSGKQVFTDYRIFRAIDRGGPAAAVADTFRDDFSGGPTTGFIEYDTFWRRGNGAYLQPETRGLLAQAVPIRNHKTGEWRPREDHYHLNAHMAAIHPWTFGDLRASFDVRVVAVDPRYGNQWVGMGFRLAHPEDSPHEADRSRRTGYYVGLRRAGEGDRNAAGDSHWRFFLGKVAPNSRGLEVLAEQQIDPPGDALVHVEVVMQGDELTAAALGHRIAARDSSYSSGCASLVMSPRAAAAYDSIVVGPSAPVSTRPN